MKPIKILRDFLLQHPETREFGSQPGLAQLTDRSESLVRAIEAGRMVISPKFARALSAATGASHSWLLQPEVESLTIPSDRGGFLSHEDVIERIESRISKNLTDASAVGLAARGGKTVGNLPPTAAGLYSKKIADQMGALVREALAQSLAEGDTHLLEGLAKLLASPRPVSSNDPPNPARQGAEPSASQDSVD